MTRKRLFFCWWDTIAKSKRFLILLMSVSFLFITSCQKEEFAQFDDGMLKSATVTATPVVIWEAQVYAGKTGLSQTVNVEADTYEPNLTLTLTNGDGSGVNTVSGVTVTINGATIISSADLRKKTSVTKTIANNPSLEITVAAKGKSTNYVTVKITGVELPPEIFTDKAGKTYKTVKIGTLTWMAENLAYLPSVYNPSVDSYTESRYYVYNYYGTDVTVAKATLNYQTYGVLYNHVAALESCPEGWRLPTKEDWAYIAKLLSTTYISNENNDAGIAMKSTSGWDVLIAEGATNGTNSSGFDGRPAGTAIGGSAAGGAGYFQEINYRGTWWTSSTFSFNSETWGYQASLYSFDEVLKIAAGPYLNFGQSVRYVKGTLPAN